MSKEQARVGFCNCTLRPEPSSDGMYEIVVDGAYEEADMDNGGVLARVPNKRDAEALVLFINRYEYEPGHNFSLSYGDDD